MSFRQLKDTEVQALLCQGCTSTDWDSIRVDDCFSPLYVQRCHFSGSIQLGRFQKSFLLPGDVPASSGLYDSNLHDCTVGNDAYIRHVKQIARYDIGDEAVIDNVSELVVTGRNGFGNGIRINALNEAGGRELLLFDRLSAQIAYLLVVYRHEPSLVERLEALIESYVQTRISDRGVIGEGARIIHSGQIRNVAVGPLAEISDVLSLEEGTVSSCREDPTFIGAGVIAKRFIILSGSKVGGSAHIESCFVGQGVRLGRQLSAEHSAFFANCEGDHSEVVSVCAGPYSVSHHKSTLLIASMVSFFNAGSGTNQSNHMYKLGPVHQAVLERGCKTGSSSYFPLPCRIGPFTTVTGRHYANFDSGSFPFSNIAEKDGQSILTPAVNLATVGARRDSEKWPARDRRRDPTKLDLIHFKLLNPFTVGRMVKGLEILYRLNEDTPKNRESVFYQGISIRRLMLKTAARYYQIGIKVFIGSCVCEKLQPLVPDADWATAKKVLQVNRQETGQWVDLLGLLAPQHRIDRLISDVLAGTVETIDDLSSRLSTMYDGYAEDEWTWCVSLLESRLEIRFNELTPRHLITVIEDWRENAVRLNKMILKDVEKEFDPISRISYGLDGDAETSRRDFKQIRGIMEENSFVRQLQDEIAAVENQSTVILDWLNEN